MQATHYTKAIKKKMQDLVNMIKHRVLYMIFEQSNIQTEKSKT